MTAEPSPRPWRAEDDQIVDADGLPVTPIDGCAGVSDANMSLIVDAVNERDRLRDIVRRLITIHQNIFWRKDEKTGMLYYDCAIDEEKMRKTIEEARVAIGESKE